MEADVSSVHDRAQRGRESEGLVAHWITSDPSRKNSLRCGRLSHQRAAVLQEMRVSGRRVLLYYAWSRPGETGASLAVIEDRFPAVFELRRLFYPRFESLSDPASVDQGIAGFLGSHPKAELCRLC